VLPFILSNRTITSGKTPYTRPSDNHPVHILSGDLLDYLIYELSVTWLLIFDAANVKALLSNNQIYFDLIYWLSVTYVNI